MSKSDLAAVNTAAAPTPHKPLRPEHRLILSYRALEARMVFDAAMAATIDHTAQHDQADAQADPSHPAHSPDAGALANALAASQASGPSGATVVFIDENVTDLATLLAHIPAGAEIVTLNSERGALSQIAAALAGRSGIDSIQIVSPGEAGALSRLPRGRVSTRSVSPLLRPH